MLGLATQVDGFTQTGRFKDLVSNLHTPNWVWISLLGIAALTWLAHGRESDA